MVALLWHLVAQRQQGGIQGLPSEQAILFLFRLWLFPIPFLESFGLVKESREDFLAFFCQARTF